MPEDAEKERLREENAKLLQERAIAAERWRDSVDDRFVAGIARMDGLNDRIKVIEDFRSRVVAQSAVLMFLAGCLAFIFWKWVDHIWK